MLIDGQSGSIVGLNTIGLRRAGYSADELTAARQHTVLFTVEVSLGQKYWNTQNGIHYRFASHLPTFLAQGRRGFVQERRSPPSSAATLRIRVADEKRNIRAKAG